MDRCTKRSLSASGDHEASSGAPRRSDTSLLSQRDPVSVSETVSEAACECKRRGDHQWWRVCLLGGACGHTAWSRCDRSLQDGATVSSSGDDALHLDHGRHDPDRRTRVLPSLFLPVRNVWVESGGVLYVRDGGA